jgi:pimeloyl-ACP methyl ester carboxylesterase
MTRYRRDLDAARRRLAAREHHSIQTPYGSVQYAEQGQGPALLFSHPLVGGFDVGLGCAETWIGDGFRVIAPSRFGYLGSSLPQGAMPADQADAYALLLDALGIERAAVVGFSAGGPSVIQFALRYPTGPPGWS